MKDVIIIGTGIAGISIAYALYKRGFKNLKIIGKDVLADESTGKSAGIVTYHLFDTHDIKLVKKSLEIYKEVYKKGFKNWIKKFNFLTIDKEKESILNLKQKLEEEKIPYDLLEPAEIKRNFPFIQKENYGIFSEESYYIDPSLFIYNIYSFLKNIKGVEFKFFTKVFKLKKIKNKFHYIETENGRIFGDLVILCTGFYTNSILKTLDLKIPLKPYRTQIGILKIKKNFKIPIIHDLESGIYLREEMEEFLLIGNGTENKEADIMKFRKDCDERFVYEVLPKSSEILPLLENSEFIGGWGHLCVATPDRKPVIGETEVKNIFVLTGFNGLGIMRAPACAEILAHYIEKQEEIPKIYDIKRLKEIEDFEIKEGFLP